MASQNYREAIAFAAPQAEDSPRSRYAPEVGASRVGGLDFDPKLLTGEAFAYPPEGKCHPERSPGPERAFFARLDGKRRIAVPADHRHAHPRSLQLLAQKHSRLRILVIPHARLVAAPRIDLHRRPPPHTRQPGHRAKPSIAAIQPRRKGILLSPPANRASPSRSLRSTPRATHLPHPAP